MSALKHYIDKISKMHPPPKEMRVSQADYVLLVLEAKAIQRYNVAGDYSCFTLMGVKIICDKDYQLTSNGKPLSIIWDKLAAIDRARILGAFENSAADKPANLHAGTLPFVSILQAYRALSLTLQDQHLSNLLREAGGIQSNEK